MAKDDYYVIVYKILTYLYSCLKAGEQANLEYLTAQTFLINENYWDYIIKHLAKENYIEGVIFVPVLGVKTKLIKLKPNISITPNGIDFLQNNSALNKAREFLKTLKETIPGL